MAQQGRTRAGSRPTARTAGARAGTQRKAAPAAGGQGLPAVYLLAALGLLVFVVSMPRLREHVVHGNTQEARQSLLLVGEMAYAHGHSDLFALLRDERSLRHRLRDARRSLDGGRLAHHGYLIDEARLADGTQVFAAWPLEYGRTGRDAWIVTPDSTVHGHPNQGAWSGEARPLTRVDLDEGWEIVDSDLR